LCRLAAKFSGFDPGIAHVVAALTPWCPRNGNLPGPDWLTVQTEKAIGKIVGWGSLLSE